MLYSVQRFIVGVGNDLRHISEMLDFEGTETPGNHILNLQRHNFYGCFPIQVSTKKILCMKLH